MITKKNYDDTETVRWYRNSKKLTVERNYWKNKNNETESDTEKEIKIMLWNHSLTASLL